MPWINSDGLPVLFGVEEAAERNIGEFGNIDGLRWVEIKLKFDDLPAVADGSVVLERTYKIPEGAVINSVEIGRPTTDWVGAGATLNIGSIDDDETSNADVDYFVQEATIDELNLGGKTRDGLADPGWGGGGHFSDPAVPFATAKKLTVEVNTAAITAGEATLYIFWSIPNIDADTLVYTKP